MIPQVTLLNIKIDSLSFSEALIKFNTSKFIVTPNIDHLYNLNTDVSFYNAYTKADLVLCDSRIISLFYLLFYKKSLFQIAGSDFFPSLCEYYKNNPSFKIFLLGGTNKENSDLARQNINNKYGLIVVDNYSPPYGFENNKNEIEKIIEIVNNSKATVLAVGVGSPKQEIFISNYMNKFTHIEHFLAIGATIDFESGKVRRSPKIISKLGFEWLYRFVQEPRRLFKRYFINGFKVLWWLFIFKFNYYKEPFN